MKILKIEFLNINSLEGKHEIDFTKNPFAQNNLFAITGPTGSGKSTILDVIPLALFNRIPRLNNPISKSLMLKHGAILTKGKAKCYAKVNYSCKKGVFTSEWSIRRAYDSSVGELQDYEMFLYDAEGKPITQKKSEVPTQNEALIGLNYEQFIKSVMLAQGEFSKFLKVKKDERSALLEQITGADIYRKIGIAAFEKYKTFKSSVEDWQKTINDIQTKLPTEEEKELILIEEKKFNQEKKLLNETIESIKNQLKLWSEWTDLNSKVEKLNSTLKDKKSAMVRFDENQGKQLIAHEKTESFADELNQFKILNQNKSELDVKFKIKTQELESALAQKKIVKKQIANWLKVDDLNEDKIAEDLEKFRKIMVAMVEERKSKRNEYTDTEKEINYLLQDLDLKYKPELDETLQNRLQQNCDFLQKENITEFSKEKFVQEKEALSVQENQIQDAERLATEIKNLQQNIQQKEDRKQTIHKELQTFPKKIENLEIQHQKTTTQLETIDLKIENQNLRKTLEDYRTQLKKSEPCPLCGSLEHPYATHLPKENTALEIEKQTLESDLKSYDTQLIQLKTKQEELSKSNQRIVEELQELKFKLKPVAHQFTTEFKTFQITDDFKDQLENIKKEEKKIEQIYQSIQEKNQLEKALPLTQKLKQIKEEGHHISKKIKKTIADKDPNTQTQKLLSAWNQAVLQLNQTQKIYDEVNQQNQSLTQELTSIKIQLLPLVLENGFADIATALDSRLSSANVQTLRQQRQTLDNELKDLNATQKVYQENVEKLKSKLQDSQQKELQEKQQATQNQINALDEKLKHIFSKKTQHSNYLQEIKDLKNKIESENKQSRVWRMLDHMIGDAKGKRFNDFAQDLTLSHLLHLANRRLDQLKSRYLLSQSIKDENDGLMAIDKDMGNQRRSVLTLSGGESFILSLALALALSDLASKNVKIDTLFIDEGFGTLDPETLDKTLDTLEKLQQENQKTIGIISHVEALKERISTQIQLSQNGYGLSELKIIG